MKMVNLKKIDKNVKNLNENYNKDVITFLNEKKVSSKDKIYIMRFIASKEVHFKVIMELINEEYKKLRLSPSRKSHIMPALNFLKSKLKLSKISSKDNIIIRKKHAQKLLSLDEVNYQWDEDTQETELKHTLSKDHELLLLLIVAFDIIDGYYYSISADNYDQENSLLENYKKFI